MAHGFSGGGMAGGIPSGDRASRGTGRATTAELTKSRPKPALKKVMPEVWKLVKPRRLLLTGSSRPEAAGREVRHGKIVAWVLSHLPLYLRELARN